MEATGEPHTPLTGPVEVVITFCLPRPKFHYYSGKKRHGELRDDAPIFVDKRPDIDKLARSTLDALTSAGMYSDDATVAHLDLWKIYADPAAMGCTITVRSLEDLGYHYILEHGE
jgi:crossover junction endodeoxyribonuclease RusA